MSQQLQINDPLHGVTLKNIVTSLVAGMAGRSWGNGLVSNVSITTLLSSPVPNSCEKHLGQEQKLRIYISRPLKISKKEKIIRN